MEARRKCRFKGPEAVGSIHESIWTEASSWVCIGDTGRGSHTQALGSLREELWWYEGGEVGHRPLED